MKMLWEFFGVSPHVPSGTADVQKQETRPLAETVLNYAELRSYFQGTPHQEYFREGAGAAPSGRSGGVPRSD
jgi:hypothetical protein